MSRQDASAPSLEPTQKLAPSLQKNPHPSPSPRPARGPAGLSDGLGPGGRGGPPRAGAASENPAPRRVGISSLFEDTLPHLCRPRGLAADTCSPSPSHPRPPPLTQSEASRICEDSPHACHHDCHCRCSLTYTAAAPSPTLSPTDPVPRGLLTLCPAARPTDPVGQSWPRGTGSVGRGAQGSVGRGVGEGPPACRPSASHVTPVH